jgi:hypothetical protein
MKDDMRHCPMIQKFIHFSYHNSTFQSMHQPHKGMRLMSRNFVIIVA